MSLTRLLLASPAARLRMAGIAVGTMVAATLILAIAGVMVGLSAKQERPVLYATIASPPITDESPPLTPEQMAVTHSVDYYRGQPIARVLVVTAPLSTAHVPGVDTLPGPGDSVMSPALADLVASAPADQLGDRYGTSIGLIDPVGLLSPDELRVIEGTTMEHLLDVAVRPSIVSDATHPPVSRGDLDRYVAITAVAFILPILVLIGTVASLGVDRRLPDLATLRLIGGTPWLASRISTAETTLGAVTGSVLGAGLYLAGLPVIAKLSVGGPFFPSDILVSPWVIAAAVVGIPVLAAAISGWQTRHLVAGSHGRDGTERRVSVFSVVPLLSGIIVLGAGVVGMAAQLWNASVTLTTLGTALTGLGLVIVMPLSASLLGRAAHRRSRHAATIIAFAQVWRHPRETSRATAGLVIAVFIATVLAWSGSTSADTDFVNWDFGESVLIAPDWIQPGAPIDASANTLAAVDGVRAVVIGYARSDGRIGMTADDARLLGLTVPANVQDVSLGGGTGTEVWPGDGTTEWDFPTTLFVATDGEAATIDRADTVYIAEGLSVSGLRQHSPTYGFHEDNIIAAFLWIGMVVAAIASAASLAVGTVAGIHRRRQEFGALKLAGLDTSTLRRIIALEDLVPTAAAFVLAITLGIGTSWATTYRRAFLTAPPPGYYWMIAVCLVLLLCSIAVVAWTVATDRRFGARGEG